MSSKTKKVWRIEHRGTKQGMYSYGFVALERLGGGRDHPGPSERCNAADLEIAVLWDNMSYSERKKWHFGFATLEQAKKWTQSDEIRKALDFEGHVLRCYVVPKENFHKSDYQAIFKNTKTKVTHTRSVCSLNKC